MIAVELREEGIGAEEALLEALSELGPQPNGSCERLDRVLQEVGPHAVAHFLALTADRAAAERLRAYLAKHWPATYELVERLIRAARRSENEDVRSDFGDS